MKYINKKTNEPYGSRKDMVRSLFVNDHKLYKEPTGPTITIVTKSFEMPTHISDEEVPLQIPEELNDQTITIELGEKDVKDVTFDLVNNKITTVYENGVTDEYELPKDLHLSLSDDLLNQLKEFNDATCSDEFITKCVDHAYNKALFSDDYQKSVFNSIKSNIPGYVQSLTEIISNLRTSSSNEPSETSEDEESAVKVMKFILSKHLENSKVLKTKFDQELVDDILDSIRSKEEK
jgi:hypothetical protein